MSKRNAVLRKATLGGRRFYRRGPACTGREDISDRRKVPSKCPKGRCAKTERQSLPMATSEFALRKDEGRRRHQLHLNVSVKDGMPNLRYSYGGRWGGKGEKDHTRKEKKLVYLKADRSLPRTKGDYRYAAQRLEKKKRIRGRGSISPVSRGSYEKIERKWKGVL